jgi:hypothetical protein
MNGEGKRESGDAVEPPKLCSCRGGTVYVCMETPKVCIRERPRFELAKARMARGQQSRNKWRALSSAAAFQAIALFNVTAGCGGAPFLSGPISDLCRPHVDPLAVCRLEGQASLQSPPHYLPPPTSN